MSKVLVYRNYVSLCTYTCMSSHNDAITFFDCSTVVIILHPTTDPTVIAVQTSIHSVERMDPTLKVMLSSIGLTDLVSAALVLVAVVKKRMKRSC